MHSCQGGLALRTVAGSEGWKKKSPQEECEAYFLIQRRNHFQQQQKNRHYLLLFIYYENKAWHGGKKMGFVLQMTCVLNPALALPVSDRRGVRQISYACCFTSQIPLQLGWEHVTGFGQCTVDGISRCRFRAKRSEQLCFLVSHTSLLQGGHGYQMM